MRMTAFMLGCMAGAAQAQMTLPTSPPPPLEGAALFAQQCGTCHVAQAGNAPPRQGPNLWGVVGRRAGSMDGFRYSRGFGAADFVWDEARLNAYLANPQSVIAGGVMAYRQANPDTRARIVAWLKEQH